MKPDRPDMDFSAVEKIIDRDFERASLEQFSVGVKEANKLFHDKVRALFTVENDYEYYRGMTELASMCMRAFLAVTLQGKQPAEHTLFSTVAIIDSIQVAAASLFKHKFGEAAWEELQQFVQAMEIKPENPV